MSEYFLGGISAGTLMLPYRPNRISDEFLLHMINPDEVRYYQDGLYLKTDDNSISRLFFRMRLVWQGMGAP